MIKPSRGYENILDKERSKVSASFYEWSLKNPYYGAMHLKVTFSASYIYRYIAAMLQKSLISYRLKKK